MRFSSMSSISSIDRPRPRVALTRPRSLIAVGVAAFVGIALASRLGGFGVSAWIARLPVLCPFRRLTGLDCPGCGMGRALARLAQGNLREAIELHPFSPVLLVWCTLWATLPSSLTARL